MATMRRDRSAWAAMALAGMSPMMVHGQKLEIHPSLDTLATATTNASDTTADPRKDLVITVTPAVSASYAGSRSRIDGTLKIDNVHFVRNSQPDRSLPSGNLLLHTDLVDQWGGLDASIDSRQMTANLLTRESSTAGVTDSYTTTQFLVAPFIERSFNADTRLSARFERSITKSTEEAQGLQSRPDSHFSNDVVKLERQPVPLGGSLEWTHRDTQDANNALSATQDVSQLQESAVRGRVSYALNEQLHTGLILGRETIRVPNTDSKSDTIKGLNVTWRPNERATLNSTVERRFFGTGWKVDWSHRLKFLTWNVTSERDASTYAAAIAGMRPLRQNTPADQNTGAGAGALLLTDPVAYSSSANVRQTWQGRMVLMGQRNVLSFGGGMDKTVPLAIGSAPALGDQTSSGFFEAQLNRRLSPATSLNTGVRWSKTRVTSNINPGATASGTSRSVLWRGAISTILSPHATATFGLRHQTVDSTLPNVNDESAMFVGLGYRY